MADNAVVHIGENSPEQVAFKLLEKISDLEGRPLYRSSDSRHTPADRQYILSTYVQCVRAVKLGEGPKS